MQSRNRPGPKRAKQQGQIKDDLNFGLFEEEDHSADPNSLLNFSLPEIQRRPPARAPNKVKKAAMPYQKERFMQAKYVSLTSPRTQTDISSYKFAVCPSIYEHIAHSNSHSRKVFDGTAENVDKILDQGVISQVVLTIHKPYQCIVCLGPPLCPYDLFFFFLFN